MNRFSLRETRIPQLAVPLAITLSIALALRLYGIEWDNGYPFTPHPDERAILMKVDQLSLPSMSDLDSLLNVEESPWNPRWFAYGSFPLYLLKVSHSLLTSLPSLDFHDLRVLGRTISALADTATVALVYLVGTRLYQPRVGLIAASLVGLSVIHIQLSHFFAVDTIAAMFSIATLFFVARVAKHGRMQDSIGAGIFIGLGIATKFSLSPIYLAFLMGHLIFALGLLGDEGAANQDYSSRMREALTGLILGVSASAVTFTIAQPYAILDFSRFLADTTEQSEMVRRIRDYPYTRQYIDTVPYWYQVRHLATWGLGAPLGIVAWAGLLYASLSGMRLIHGLSYLFVGWVVPMLLLIFNNGVAMIAIASSIAFLGLVATLPLRSIESRGTAILLSWVVPYLLITGSFQVKFLRYLLPVTPFLILFGTRMILDLWDISKVKLPSLRPLLYTGLLLLITVTGFYAVSYTSIYTQDHPAIRTGRWITENAKPGSLILKEHWEEGIPGLHGFTLRELPLYNDDNHSKAESLAKDLSDADYLVFYSDRLYGTIPRLPERYPISNSYYHLLFSGQLGYQVVNVESSYPHLLGVAFANDTFSRPRISTPELAASESPTGILFNMGAADESFTVYDHPMNLVLENKGRFSPDTIKQLLLKDWVGKAPLPDSRELGLMLTKEISQVQRRGGTWTQIIKPRSWSYRYPVLAWLLLIEAMSLLVLPITFMLFRHLPDRGYLFAKTLGILLVSILVWLLASYHLVSFSQVSLMISAVILAAISLPILIRNRGCLTRFISERWRMLAFAEVVFISAFLIFVVIRMANPDLWHPYLGGEKPMDMAYLIAVLKSSYMPPYDPWFAGGYINYYYWGQFMVATLIRGTGIEPTVAFNLAVPLFFALTFGSAYSLVYNLASGSIIRNKLDSKPPTIGLLGQVLRSPVSAGLMGGIFVTILGNLDGAVQIIGNLWQQLILGGPIETFDFWRSTRVMLPDPPGHEITEFPFFTFLFGDLHAHLMAIPFTILVIGISLSIVVGVRDKNGYKKSMSHGQGFAELGRLVILGLAVGSLRLINTWDFPAYLLLACISVLLAEYFRNGGLSLMVIIKSGLKILLVTVSGFLTFLPYHLAYETFFSSFESTTNQTVLWHFLLIHGLFIFVVGSFFLVDLRGYWSACWGKITGILQSETTSSSLANNSSRHRLNYKKFTSLTLVVFLFGYLAINYLSGVFGSTIPFVIVLLALVLVSASRHLWSDHYKDPRTVFVSILIGTALVIVIGVDIVRVEGDIDRMNSIFKFYLQVWVLLGIASAYLVWRQIYMHSIDQVIPRYWRHIWVTVLVLLIAGTAIYPIFGTQMRLRSRFEILPMTLDGTAYMRSAVYSDPHGKIALAPDYEGIQWLLTNVSGSPVVLEGLTPNYRWGGRISVYTGLPTVIGWQWHQEQQRRGYSWAIGERARDVDRIYRTSEMSEAIELLWEYGVEYIYIGQLERLYYPRESLSKFRDTILPSIELVYENEGVEIYRIQPR